MNNTNYSEASHKDFVAAVAEMGTLSAFLSAYTEADYAEKGATCYLNTDKRSGYAITADNDLISVFSLPGANQGNAAVDSAIENGATTLDCIGDFLAKFYASKGFTVTERITWNDDYAPEGWDYDRFGRPDVIMMSRS